jgi:hypothetical protein
VVVFGFVEFAPDVCEAADGDDFKLRVALAEGAVGSQAVALEVAGERGVSVIVDEDVVEAGVGPAFASEFDAVAGSETPFLTVEGLVVAELFGEQEGSEAGGEGAGKSPEHLPSWLQIRHFLLAEYTTFLPTRV